MTTFVGHSLGAGPLAARDLEPFGRAALPGPGGARLPRDRHRRPAVDGHFRPYPNDLGCYIVFFPLFPWLVDRRPLRGPRRAGQRLRGERDRVARGRAAPLPAGQCRRGPPVGLRAAWFLLIFPTAYFLHIGYTESLFLALVLGSFLAARTDRWWLAGILGGLAALTRINGLVLIPALAAEAWLAWDEDPQHRLRGPNGSRSGWSRSASAATCSSTSSCTGIRSPSSRSSPRTGSSRSHRRGRGSAG